MYFLMHALCLYGFTVCVYTMLVQVMSVCFDIDDNSSFRINHPKREPRDTVFFSDYNCGCFSQQKKNCVQPKHFSFRIILVYLFRFGTKVTSITT